MIKLVNEEILLSYLGVLIALTMLSNLNRHFGEPRFTINIFGPDVR